ncbi:MAG: DUF998 domain-containing protein, partial [Endomicrobia bacterium]|nr:DUF998 domain-containing protein [Endomicrobiia bacterium]
MRGTAVNQSVTLSGAEGSAQSVTEKVIASLRTAKNVEVVITGGFHTDGVSEILAQNNISYIVITPNVTGGVQLAEDTYYKIAKEQAKISFQALATLNISQLPTQEQYKFVADAFAANGGVINANVIFAMNNVIKTLSNGKASIEGTNEENLTLVNGQTIYSWNKEIQDFVKSGESGAQKSAASANSAAKAFKTASKITRIAAIVSIVSASIMAPFVVVPIVVSVLLGVGGLSLGVISLYSYGQSIHQSEISRKIKDASTLSSDGTAEDREIALSSFFEKANIRERRIKFVFDAKDEIDSEGNVINEVVMFSNGELSENGEIIVHVNPERAAAMFLTDSINGFNPKKGVDVIAEVIINHEIRHHRHSRWSENRVAFFDGRFADIMAIAGRNFWGRFSKTAKAEAKTEAEVAGARLSEELLEAGLPVFDKATALELARISKDKNFRWSYEIQRAFQEVLRDDVERAGGTFKADSARSQIQVMLAKLIYQSKLVQLSMDGGKQGAIQLAAAQYYAFNDISKNPLIITSANDDIILRDAEALLRQLNSANMLEAMIKSGNINAVDSKKGISVGVIQRGKNILLSSGANGEVISQEFKTVSELQEHTGVLFSVGTNLAFAIMRNDIAKKEHYKIIGDEVDSTLAQELLSPAIMSGTADTANAKKRFALAIAADKMAKRLMELDPEKTKHIFSVKNGVIVLNEAFDFTQPMAGEDSKSEDYFDNARNLAKSYAGLEVLDDAAKIPYGLDTLISKDDFYFEWRLAIASALRANIFANAQKGGKYLKVDGQSKLLDENTSKIQDSMQESFEGLAVQVANGDSVELEKMVEDQIMLLYVLKKLSGENLEHFGGTSGSLRDNVSFIEQVTGKEVLNLDGISYSGIHAANLGSLLVETEAQKENVIFRTISALRGRKIENTNGVKTLISFKIRVSSTFQAENLLKRLVKSGMYENATKEAAAAFKSAGNDPASFVKRFPIRINQVLLVDDLLIRELGPNYRAFVQEFFNAGATVIHTNVLSKGESFRGVIFDIDSDNASKITRIQESGRPARGDDIGFYWNVNSREQFLELNDNSIMDLVGSLEPVAIDGDKFSLSFPSSVSQQQAGKVREVFTNENGEVDSEKEAKYSGVYDIIAPFVNNENNLTYNSALRKYDDRITEIEDIRENERLSSGISNVTDDKRSYFREKVDAIRQSLLDGSWEIGFWGRTLTKDDLISLGRMNYPKENLSDEDAETRGRLINSEIAKQKLELLEQEYKNLNNALDKVEYNDGFFIRNNWINWLLQKAGFNIRDIGANRYYGTANRYFNKIQTSNDGIKYKVNALKFRTHLNSAAIKRMSIKTGHTMAALGLKVLNFAFKFAPVFGTSLAVMLALPYVAAGAVISLPAMLLVAGLITGLYYIYRTYLSKAARYNSDQNYDTKVSRYTYVQNRANLWEATKGTVNNGLIQMGTTLLFSAVAFFALGVLTTTGLVITAGGIFAVAGLGLAGIYRLANHKATKSISDKNTTNDKTHIYSGITTGAVYAGIIAAIAVFAKAGVLASLGVVALPALIAGGIIAAAVFTYFQYKGRSSLVTQKSLLTWGSAGAVLGGGAAALVVTLGVAAITPSIAVLLS